MSTEGARRIRLTFVSEFDWGAEELTEEGIRDIVEQFIDSPDSFISPVDEDEVIYIDVEDITEEG